MPQLVSTVRETDGHISGPLEPVFEDGVLTDRLSVVTKLADYVHRPEALSEISYFQYVQWFQKRPIPRDQSTGLPKTTGRYSNWCPTSGHPHSSSHYYVKRKRPHIPHLTGARLMDSRLLQSGHPDCPDDVEERREMFAATILGLFVPFRSPGDIQQDYGSLWEAYQSWEPTSAEQQYILNLQEYHLAKEVSIKLKAVTCLAPETLAVTTDPDAELATADMDDTSDDDDEATALASTDAWATAEAPWAGMGGPTQVPPTEIVLQSKVLNQLLHCDTSGSTTLDKSSAKTAMACAVDSVVSAGVTANAQRPVRLPAALQSLEDSNTAYFKDFSVANMRSGKLPAGVKFLMDRDTGPTAADSNGTAPDMWLQASHAQKFSAAIRATNTDPNLATSADEPFASLASISVQFNLAPEQHVAFMMAGAAYLKELFLKTCPNLLDHPVREGGSLRHRLDIFIAMPTPATVTGSQNSQAVPKFSCFLTGEPGTGKSRVVEALEALDRSWAHGARSRVIILAPTGMAVACTLYGI